MQKPITLAREEFMGKIVNAVNESGLPLIIIEPVLKDMIGEIQSAIKQQTEADRNAYTQYLINKDKEQSDAPEPEQEG